MIVKGKFSKEDILKKEIEILNCLNFKVSAPTIFDIMVMTYKLLDFKTAEQRDFFERSSLVLINMCLFSYELVSKMPIEELGLCSMIISLKLAEKLLAFKTSRIVSL